MTAIRDTKGRFIKGSIANPRGRPKQKATLTDILRGVGNKKRKTGKGATTERKFLAQNIWSAVNEGMATLSSGRTIEVSTIKDWFTIVAWLYDRVDGKPTENIQVNEPEAEITAEDLAEAHAKLEEWKKNRGRD